MTCRTRRPILAALFALIIGLAFVAYAWRVENYFADEVQENNRATCRSVQDTREVLRDILLYEPSPFSPAFQEFAVDRLVIPPECVPALGGGGDW